MAYEYGKVSESRLVTCHPKLIELCRELIKWEDVHIVCGFRSEEAQELMFSMDRSLCHWPDSNHNKQPSLAVDLVPWSASRKLCLWEDMFMIGRMAGTFLQIARSFEIDIRYGPDFMPAHIFDAYHFELV